MKIGRKLFLFILAIAIFFFGFFSREALFKQNKIGVTPTLSIAEFKEGEYKVIRVIDGDTVVIKGNQKVRYQGIDAPELNTSWSTEAVKLNTDLVLNKKVRIELDRQKFDAYNRILAYVWIDGVMVNEKLLEEGYAKIKLVRGEAKPKYLDRLQKAENWAKDHHNGVWFNEWIKVSPYFNQ